MVPRVQASSHRLLQIRPQTAGLPYVEMDVWTRRGPVHFKSVRKKGRCTLSLDIPEGVEAELWLDGKVTLVKGKVQIKTK